MPASRLGSIGTFVAVIAALVTLAVNALLPYTLESGFLSSLLLRSEGAAELAAAIAFPLCAVEVFRASRDRARRRVAVAVVGLVVAGVVLLPTLIAAALAFAMAAGGAIPR